MKTVFILSALIASQFSFCISNQAQACDSFDSTLTDIQITLSHTTRISTLDLINWKVGDTANFDVSAGMLGKMGTVVQSVASEEGAALWVKSTTNLQGQNSIEEMLLNKADGKILKYKHNGQDAEIPSHDFEIVSQDYTEVTVPAGTFKCMHVVAKSSQAKKIEIWANPQATVMQGNLKTIASTNFGIDLTIELTSFSHGQ